MEKLLSICIPTFNRSQLLDKQLAWLAKAIQGFESECEILVSDNCSTDDTPAVIEKWRPLFAKTVFWSNRNSKNIGAVRNIAYCISAARGKYVWTISDDDRIFDQTLAYIVSNLTQYPDLSLLLLNYASRAFKTGKLNWQHCFDVDTDIISSDGQGIFEYCLSKRGAAGLALTTALVYRTQLARQAIIEWQPGLDNFFVQLYWTAFCALQGRVKVTKDNYLECTGNYHHFTEQFDTNLQARHVDLPAVYVKLSDLGYSEKLCGELALTTFKGVNWLKMVRHLRRRPGFLAETLGRQFTSIGMALFLLAQGQAVPSVTGLSSAFEDRPTVTEAESIERDVAGTEG